MHSQEWNYWWNLKHSVFDEENYELFDSSQMGSQLISKLHCFTMPLLCWPWAHPANLILNTSPYNTMQSRIIPYHTIQKQYHTIPYYTKPYHWAYSRLKPHTPYLHIVGGAAYMGEVCQTRTCPSIYHQQLVISQEAGTGCTFIDLPNFNSRLEWMSKLGAWVDTALVAGKPMQYYANQCYNIHIVIYCILYILY